MTVSSYRAKFLAMKKKQEDRRLFFFRIICKMKSKRNIKDERTLSKQKKLTCTYIDTKQPNEIETKQSTKKEI